MKKLLLITITALFLLTNSTKALRQGDLMHAFFPSLTEEEKQEVCTAIKREYVSRPADQRDGTYDFYCALQASIPQADIPAEAAPGAYDQAVQVTYNDRSAKSTRYTKAIRRRHQEFASIINWYSSSAYVHTAFLIKLTTLIIEKQTTLPPKKWEARFCHAFTGTAKIAPWLQLHTMRQSSFMQNDPKLFFNGLKLLSLYVLFDFTHHYGADIAAKNFPAINKCDNALRSRIKYYDTFKDKLGWLAKASLAAYQSHVYL